MLITIKCFTLRLKMIDVIKLINATNIIVTQKQTNVIILDSKIVLTLVVIAVLINANKYVKAQKIK